MSDPEALVEAIKDFRNGKRSADSLANIAYPIILKISKISARRAGVDDGDLAQELWLTFREVIIKKFDITKPIQPFIYGCAQKVALSLLDPHRHNEVYLSDEGHAAVEAEDQINNEKYHVDFIGELDRKSALDKISSSLYYNRVTLTSKDRKMQKEEVLEFALPEGETTLMTGGEINLSTKPPPYKEKVKPKKKPLSLLQKEIVDARASLDMTQDKFSKELDINIFSLSSYEYGRADPPEKLMQKVRILVGGGNPRLTEIRLLKKKYEQPMSEILKKWCNDYKLDYTNDRQLALAMDTTSATVHRWKNDDVKPSPDGIESYRKSMENGAKKMHYSVDNFKKNEYNGVLVRA